MNKNNKIQKNRIVVVKEGLSYGNSAGTITKVLSQDGEANDALFIATGQLKHKRLLGSVQCELEERKYIGATCNNKSCTYEFISDLRIATKLEVKAFQKGIRHISKMACSSDPW